MHRQKLQHQVHTNVSRKIKSSEYIPFIVCGMYLIRILRGCKRVKCAYTDSSIYLRPDGVFQLFR